MGEIDTKPIESVQSSLSLFGEKYDQRKFRSTGSEGKRESEKEIELELMLKEVANYKVQLEVKEYDYNQALLKLSSYRITVDELSNKLKSSAAERDQLTSYCKEAKDRIYELESKIKEISDLLLEAGNANEQLVHATNELKITQEELVIVKSELAAAEESNSAAMNQLELMSIAVSVEKEKTEELLTHVSELNEAILVSKRAAIETEKENCTILSEKEAEIEMAVTAAGQAEEQLEEIRNRVDVIPDLENQLLEKTLFVDSLRLELKQVKELHNSSEKAAFDAINELNRLKSELELIERANSDQSIYVQSTEAEMKQLRIEFRNAKEEVDNLNREIEMLTGEMKKAEIEKDEIKGRESEAQIEIALLKSELHKGRSKIAAAEAAEAAEARAKIEQSGAYLAAHQLSIEAEKAKKETQSMQREASFAFYNPQLAECMPLDVPHIEESRAQVEETRDDSDGHITITMKEFESLIRIAEKADQDASHEIHSGSSHELHVLRKELDAAMEEIGELRSVAEQAVIRAEMAERAKAAVEGQLRKWREHQQKKRLAVAALREESTPKESNPPTYEKPARYKIPANYQPLGKVLNMKF